MVNVVMAFRFVAKAKPDKDHSFFFSMYNAIIVYLAIKQY